MHSARNCLIVLGVVALGLGIEASFLPIPGLPNCFCMPNLPPPILFPTIGQPTDLPGLGSFSNLLAAIRAKFLLGLFTNVNVRRPPFLPPPTLPLIIGKFPFTPINPPPQFPPTENQFHQFIPINPPLRIPTVLPQFPEFLPPINPVRRFPPVQWPLFAPFDVLRTRCQLVCSPNAANSNLATFSATAPVANVQPTGGIVGKLPPNTPVQQGSIPTVSVKLPPISVNAPSGVTHGAVSSSGLFGNSQNSNLINFLNDLLRRSLSFGVSIGESGAPTPFGVRDGIGNTGADVANLPSELVSYLLSPSFGVNTWNRQICKRGSDKNIKTTS